MSGQRPRSAAGCALRATSLRCSVWGRGAELTSLRSVQTADAESVYEVRCAHRPQPCAARRARCPAKASPSAPGGNAPAGGQEYRSRFFVWKVALTSHRGCVNARGHRAGGAPGLTRTSGQAVGVPSRDGRCGRLRRPGLAVAAGVLVLMPSADCRHFASSRLRIFVQAARRRRRRASSSTTSNVGAPARRSRQARRRVAPSAAGIDAASMARRYHLPNNDT